MEKSLMKLIRLATLLAACLFALAAGAQQNAPAQENAEHKHGGQMRSSEDMVQDLTTKLNLTADQQTKIKSIQDEQHQQHEDGRDRSGVRKEPAREVGEGEHEPSGRKEHDGDAAARDAVLKAGRHGRAG